MVDEGKARADRPVTAPLLHVRLAEQLERCKQESTWRTSGHDAITLTKEPALRLVLMLFSKGTKLPEHRQPHGDRWSGRTHRAGGRHGA